MIKVYFSLTSYSKESQGDLEVEGSRLFPACDANSFNTGPYFYHAECVCVGIAQTSYGQAWKW